MDKKIKYILLLNATSTGHTGGPTGGLTGGSSSTAITSS